MTYHKNFSTASDSIPLKNIQPCDNPDCLPPSLRRTEMAQHHNTASCGQETASPANTGSDNKSTKVQHKYYRQSNTISIITKSKLECGPMPNMMVALPNIGGALCSTPQSLADAHY